MINDNAKKILIWKKAFEKDIKHLFKDELNIKNYSEIVNKRLSFNRGSEILDEVEQHIDLTNKKILDIGSGWGDLEYEALKRQYNIIGVEPFQKLLNLSHLLLHDKKNLIKKGSVENLPFKNNSFDVIICYTVLEHVKDYKRAIKEMNRVLKPKGRLYLELPNYLFPNEGHYKVWGLFMLPKSINICYLKLLGKNPDFFRKYVHPITSYQVLKQLKNNDFTIFDISLERINKKGLLYQTLGFFKLYSNITLIATKNN